MQTQRIMTQEKCERAVKALQQHGFKAHYVQRRPVPKPLEHMVWMDVLNKEGDVYPFRINDEEIEWWQTQDK